MTWLDLSMGFYKPDAIVAGKVAWGREVAKLEKLWSLALHLQVGGGACGLRSAFAQLAAVTRSVDWSPLTACSGHGLC